MNTAKRWLAGLLSFAMIFTSAGLSSFGTAATFAAETNEVEATIGETTNKYETLEAAIAQANVDRDVDKTVTIKLLKDTSVSDRGETITRPLIIDLNNHKLSDDKYFTAKTTNQPWKEGNESYDICMSKTYTDGVLTGYAFKKHDPVKEYHWTFDLNNDPIWYVDSYRENCDNCGLGEQIYDVGSSSYNPTLHRYEYREGSEVVEVFEAVGTSLYGEGPFWTFDGTAIRHKDGVPVAEATLINNETCTEAETSITVTPADLAEINSNKCWVGGRYTSGPEADALYQRIKWLAQGESCTDYVYSTNEMWYEFDRGVIKNIDPTCTMTGVKIYKVVVKDADGKELITRYIADTQLPKADHEQGPVKEIQLLKRFGYEPVVRINESTGKVIENVNIDHMFATEGEAREAGIAVFGEDFEETSSVKMDLRGHDGELYKVDDTPDGVKETTVWFAWGWVVGNRDLHVFKNASDPLDLTGALRPDGSFSYRPVFWCINEVYNGEQLDMLLYYEDVMTVNEIIESYIASLENEGDFNNDFLLRILESIGFGVDDLDRLGFNPNALEVNERLPEFFTLPTTMAGDRVDVSPLDDTTTAAEHEAVVKALDENKNPENSICNAWFYEPIPVEFNYHATSTSTTNSKATYTYYPGKDDIRVAGETGFGVYKPEELFSHVSTTDLDFTGGVEPTCDKPGYAFMTCDICGEQHARVNVEATGEHTKGQYAPGAADPKWYEVDDTLAEPHAVTIIRDTYTIAKLAPTCTERGGDYFYCTNGHWYLDTPSNPLTHDLSDVIANNGQGSHWEDSRGNIPNPANGDWAVPNEEQDYIYKAEQKCNNPGCAGLTVRYHSITGPADTETDKYGRVSWKVNAAGENCMSYAKVVYTVAGLKDGNKDNAAITYEVVNTEDRGPHKLSVKSFKWSEDFEKATAVGVCDICKAEGIEEEAKVTQTTATNGITTFVAACNGKTDTQKAFTLKNAKVSFDASLIADGNLVVNHPAGGSQQVPDVTVTINGTVIDPSLYTAKWTYNNQKKVVTVEVDWTAAVKGSGDADVVNATATSSVNVDAKRKIKANWKYTLNGVEKSFGSASDYGYNMVEADYDPNNTYEIVPVIIPDDAAVKYAVVNKLVEGKDYNDCQKKIEDLKYTEDKVVIHDAGDYYVYAQITKDGYTTYTRFAGAFIITRPEIYVQIDDCEVTVGEDPSTKLAKRAYDETTNKAIEVNWDEDFKITTVGGKSLKDLDAGVYKLNVQAPNYNIRTVNESYIGTLTVLAKDQAVVDAEAIAAELVAATTDDQLAAAYAKYLALSDELKKVVESNNEAKAKLADAKKAYDASEAAKKAAEELAQAKTAADTALKAADAYKGDAAVANAIKALNDAIAKNDTAAIKTATAALNSAVDAAKKAAEPKNSSIKISTGKKTVYTGSKKNKKLKKKQSFKIKYSKTGDGTVSFKKVSGSKKLSISKSGKITVKKNTKAGTYKIKVQGTIAGTKNYKAASASKTIKVTVKKGKKK